MTLCCFASTSCFARALVALACSALPSSADTVTIKETVESTTTVTTVTQTLPYAEPTSSNIMSVGGSNASWTGSDFKDAVLNSTNTYREQYGAEALEWDSELADFAEDHAENCIWKHSEDGPYGENLAVNYPSPTLSIDAWANEEEDFDWEKRTFSESVGHFTQLVWQNTTTVGCAAVECHDTSDDGANGWFLVCEYAPAGNVKGAFKTNVLKPGMSEEGEVGLGSAGPKMGGGARSVLALAVATVLTGMFL